MPARVWRPTGNAAPAAAKERGAPAQGRVTTLTEKGVFVDIGTGKDAFLPWRNCTLDKDNVRLGAFLEGLCVESSSGGDQDRRRGGGAKTTLRGPYSFGEGDNPWGTLRAVEIEEDYNAEDHAQEVLPSAPPHTHDPAAWDASTGWSSSWSGTWAGGWSGSWWGANTWGPESGSDAWAATDWWSGGASSSAPAEHGGNRSAEEDFDPGGGREQKEDADDAYHASSASQPPSKGGKAASSKGKAGAGAKADNPLQVVVSNLPFGIDEWSLEKEFGDCGELKECKLLRDRETGKSRGIAFLTFEDEAGVQAALEYDGDEFEGRTLRVSKAGAAGKKGKGKGASGDGKAAARSRANQYKVVVGNLSFKIDEETLRRDFEECGEIKDLKLLMDQETGRSKGLAFITFADEAGMLAALEFDEDDYGGRKLKVSRAEDRRPPDRSFPAEEAYEPTVPAPASGASAAVAPAKAPATPATAAPAQLSRPALKAKVFAHFDADGDGLLMEAELRKFAEETGFDGDEESWLQEYELLCREVHREPSQGLDRTSFFAIVDDESDGGCYCSDEELRAMLPTAAPVAVAAPTAAEVPLAFAAEAPAAPAAAGTRTKDVAPASMSRDELKTAVFRLHDVDGDGFLGKAELQSFASKVGFDGSDEDWASEYDLLCRDVGCDPARGVPPETFAAMVDDDSDSGCYAADEELREMLATAPAPATAASPQQLQQQQSSWEEEPEEPAVQTREDVKRALFRKLDVDKDGHLNSVEMMPFVRENGFDGPDEEWPEEYDLLCKDIDCEPSTGVSERHFMALLDDESDTGCYCTYEQLQEILAKIAPAQPAPGHPKVVEKSRAEPAPIAAKAPAANTAPARRDDPPPDDGFDPWSTNTAKRALERQREKAAAEAAQGQVAWTQWTDAGKPGASTKDPSKPALDASKLLEASRAALAARKAQAESAPKPASDAAADNDDDSDGGFYDDFASDRQRPATSSSAPPPSSAAVAPRATTMAAATARMASAIARLLAGDAIATQDLMDAVLGAPSLAHALAVVGSAARSVLQGRAEDARTLLSLDALPVDPGKGEAALLSALGCLAARSGSPGAPLMLRTLLSVLICADDKHASVRSAASSAAEAVVGAVDAMAFEALLPSLSAALEPKRSPALKTLALKLLALCWRGDGEAAVAQKLPVLLPLVSPLLLDTKTEVRSAARDAMDVLMSLCGNADLKPHLSEIRECASGSRDVTRCVRELAEVVFVQRVEAPALAVVMPVLTKGLKSRNAATKRQSCVIAENMCRLLPSVADVEAFAPQLLPLLDRVAEEAADPDVRAVAGRARSSLGRVADVDAATTVRLELKGALAAATAACAPKGGGNSSSSSGLRSGGDVMEACPAPVREVILDYLVHLSVGLGRCGVAAEDEWMRKLLPHLEPLVGFGSTSTLRSLARELRNAGLRLCSSPEAQEQRHAVADDVDSDSTDDRVVCDCTFTLACGAATLLSDARLRLVEGRIYGLAGGNDSGKSALLRAIHERKLKALGASISNRSLVTCLVEHGAGEAEPECDWTPSQYLLGDSALSSTLTEPQARAALRKVGFSDGPQLERPLKELSGGWRMKLSLARAMLQDADILLLDEPTGHLDTAHVDWLVRYLNDLREDEKRKVTVLVVSHEASFLDRVCTHIIHVADHKLATYRGNFTHFLERVPNAQLGSGAAGGADKSGNPQAGGDMDEVAAFVLPEPGPLEGVKSRGKRFLSLEAVSYRYPGSRTGPAIRGATIECSLRSRVACIGPNGAGKSTLASLVVGELAPDAGSAWRHPNLRVAFVAQHTFHHLERHLNLTATQYLLWRFEGNEDREALEFRAASEEATASRSYRLEEGRLVACAEDDPRVLEVETVLDRRQRGRLGYEYEVRWRGRGDKATTTWLTRGQLDAMGCLGMARREDERQAAMRALATRPLTTPAVEAHLAGFGLNAEEASHRRLGALSNGQRARAVLGAATWLAPHLLVLDEPSNYLDRPALSALAAGLQAFGGGVIMISHNESLLEQVCTERWLVRSGMVHREGASVPEAAGADNGAEDQRAAAAASAAAAAAREEARERKKQKRLKELRRKNGEVVSDDEEEWWQDLSRKANAKKTPDS